jgi:predicted DNA-binding protein (MmcQ/YjbR family)
MAGMPSMDRDHLLAYCLAKPGSWQDEPWEGDVVTKVADKIFVFLGSGDGPISIGVKCGRDRDEADEWLERYPGDATVSAYIGRYGWNSLTVGGAIPDAEIREAIDTSYAQVVSRLPRAKRPT